MSYENTSFLNIALKDNATIIKGVKKMFSKNTPRGARKCWIETSSNAVVNITVLFWPTIPSKLLRKMNVCSKFQISKHFALGKIEKLFKFVLTIEPYLNALTDIFITIDTTLQVQSVWLNTVKYFSRITTHKHCMLYNIS